MPLFVLGGGSNLLVSDTGFDGLVLHITIGGIEAQERGEKRIFSADGEVIHTLVFTYPRTLKGRYDAIAARVAASFGGP